MSFINLLKSFVFLMYFLVALHVWGNALPTRPENAVLINNDFYLCADDLITFNNFDTDGISKNGAEWNEALTSEGEVFLITEYEAGPDAKVLAIYIDTKRGIKIYKTWEEALIAYPDICGIIKERNTAGQNL